MERHRTFEDPPFAKMLFGSTYFSWLWLIIRLYVGYQWVTAGWGKFNNEKWIGSGVALQAFWQKAVMVPETGKPPIVYDWYREFLVLMLEGGHHTWFAKVVVFGELAIGLGLILGAFVGIAAFFGGFMNWNFMMAGTASTNPMLLTLALLLVLAWKTAGYYGLDRWLLPMVGTPWQPGEVFHGRVPQGGVPPVAVT